MVVALESYGLIQGGNYLHSLIILSAQLYVIESSVIAPAMGVVNEAQTKYTQNFQSSMLQNNTISLVETNFAAPNISKVDTLLFNFLGITIDAQKFQKWK